MKYAATMALAAALWGDTPPKRPGATVPFEQIAKQADVAREQNQMEKAVALYRQGLNLRPEWKEGWWYLSTVLYDGDRYQEARDGFRRYVALEPKAGPGMALLGLCEFQTREYTESLLHLSQARRLGIENAQMGSVVMYHVALLLTRFEQFEAAGQILLGFAQRGEVSPAIVEASGLAGLRRPLLPAELPPQERDMIYRAGRAVCAAGARKVTEAQQEFGQLVSLYPDKPNVHFLYGSFLLPGDPEGGVREFGKELELNPNHLPALVATAMEYVKEGDPAKGLPMAQKAVTVDPQSFAAHAAYGKVLMETGDLEHAIPELQLAERLAPDSPQVRIALASAFAKAGRNEEAAKERIEFLRLKKLGEADDGK